LTVQPGAGNDETVGTPDVVNMNVNAGKALRFVAPPTATKRFTISGTNFADEIATGAGADLVYGLDGNDVVELRGGGDSVFAGDGNDLIKGGEGEDAELSGGSGINTLSFDDGRTGGGTAVVYPFGNGFPPDSEDTFYNISVLEGGPGADNLTFKGLGGGGTLRGGGGADLLTLTTAGTIFGGAGADTITGSDSDDMLRGGPDGDTFTGGGGTDTVSYDDQTAPVTVTIGAGSGDDGNAADGAPGARDNVGGDVEKIVGSPFGDTLSGNAIVNLLLGGDGADTLDGGLGADTASYADHAAGLRVELNASAGATNEDTMTGMENLLGSTFDDTLIGDAAANVIDRAAGKDRVIGDHGHDHLLGGEGDDEMISEDSEVDDVDCGPGIDHPVADAADLLVNCDDSTVVVVDKDGDGAPVGNDCDDNDPARAPGKPDVPGNGVDEDCSGADAPVDLDADGTPAAADCNDHDPAIRPGAIEIVGNAVDENCDGLVVPFPKLDVGVVNSWLVSRDGTKVVLLEVRRVPAGATVVVKCKPPRGRKGCAFKSKTFKPARAGTVKLLALFRGRRLPVGTRVVVTITAPGHIGRKVTYRTVRTKVPTGRVRCLSPGGAAVAC
jgi:Ca2+-binding RTX toxin-like protein